MSRRTVLALATGSLVLGGFAAPALAAPATAALAAPATAALAAPAGVDSEQVCVITRYEPDKGTREGFCVWFPKVIPDLP
jgi:hypothetical protein